MAPRADIVERVDPTLLKAAASPRDLPYPPPPLMNRVGHLGEQDDLEAAYDAVGATVKDSIVSHMPEGWTFEDKRVLDFGCGAGRVMRQFLPEVQGGAEIWGSEIDEASVQWLNAQLAPTFKAVLCGEQPPIAAPDGHFDLIYAISVFTHITSEWAPWVLEMHRLLKPDGLLYVSLLGQQMIDVLLQEPWDEDRVGHLIAALGTPWDRGGPFAFNSEWWLRAHWGRAFEVVWMEPAVARGAHDIALLRRKPVAPTRAELEAPEPGEPRELRAAQYNLEILARETMQLRERLAMLEEK